MKIKYKLSDGSIIAMGELPNMVAGPGESIIDLPVEIPQQRVDFYKVEENAIILRPVGERNAILDSEAKAVPQQVIAKVNAVTTINDKIAVLTSIVDKLASKLLRSDDLVE